MQRRVRRCNFCGITLCRGCKHDGVCPRDFSILLPAERNRLNSTSYLIENGCGCSIGTCFLVLLIGLGIGTSHYGVIGILGPAIFILISMSIGFIVGGKNGKKKVMADILSRMNADLGALKQSGFQDTSQEPSPSTYAPLGNNYQRANNFPQSSFIPPPAESLDFQSPAEQAIPATPNQDALAASGPGTQYCNACGARLFLVDGQIPAFCASCGNPVK